MTLKTREEKGITLIALIITIVVLVILAVVSIASVSNDGIFGKAETATNSYEQSAKNEQDSLDSYVNILNNPTGSGSDSSEGENSGTGDNSTEGENPGSGSDTSDIEYAIGTEVTIGSESFYVIKNSKFTDDTVVLLAKQNIDTTNLVQSSSAATVAFSTEKYWTQTDKPYDIVEPEQIPESHIAAKAASDYGKKVGGTGRIMLKSEADELYAIETFKSKLTATIFWLCTVEPLDADFGETPLVSSVNRNATEYGPPYANSVWCGVRPVITIAKTALS